MYTAGGGNLGGHHRILPTTDRVTISEYPGELPGGKIRQIETTEHSVQVRIREPECIYSNPKKISSFL